MEEKSPKIFSAICGVMEDIGAVSKNGVNKKQGFKYRGIDDVINALNPAMVKHKIFCVPEILEQKREGRKTANGNEIIYSICRIRYKFFAIDGSSVEAVVIGESMDSGDKATNKAMSVAFKYACFQVFCIPTEELMDDPDKETPEPSVPESGPTRWVMSEKEAEIMQAEMERTGTKIEKILERVKKKRINDLTKEDYESIMRIFQKTPDKNTPSPPPEGDPYYEGLPFK